MSEAILSVEDVSPLPPSCPECGQDVVLIEHGYYSSAVTWDPFIGDWMTDPEERSLSWNGTETYWQCRDSKGECGWYGGDPDGLQPDEEED